MIIMEKISMRPNFVNYFIQQKNIVIKLKKINLITITTMIIIIILMMIVNLMKIHMEKITKHIQI